jgi:hypothetical protein
MSSNKIQRKIIKSRMTKRIEAIEQQQELILRAVDRAVGLLERRLEKLEELSPNGYKETESGLIIPDGGDK